jgi:hypothetical protein
MGALRHHRHSAPHDPGDPPLGGGAVDPGTAPGRLTDGTVAAINAHATALALA